MANTYGDITPRTAAYAAAKLLDRALPFMCMARFGQQQPIPRNKTQAVKFRRYNGWAPSTTPLTEGVTPVADNISNTDVTATLAEYGRRTQITDVIADTHEDPVLTEYAEVMGELAGQTQETVVYNAIRAGTNVRYANNVAARANVTTGVSDNDMRVALRQLERQNAKRISKMMAGSDKVGTVPIPPAFIAFCHPDLRGSLKGLTGWKEPHEYGTYGPLGDNEMGSAWHCRFMSSTLYAPWLAAGASSVNNLSNGAIPGAAAAADVYPIVIVGADAYATVSLAGATAITPVVVNPTPSDSDPLGQRGHVGFKFYSTACILNDAWMVRVEVSCPV